MEFEFSINFCRYKVRESLNYIFYAFEKSSKTCWNTLSMEE